MASGTSFKFAASGTFGGHVSNISRPHGCQRNSWTPHMCQCNTSRPHVSMVWGDNCCWHVGPGGQWCVRQNVTGNGGLMPLAHAGRCHEFSLGGGRANVVRSSGQERVSGERCGAGAEGGVPAGAGHMAGGLSLLVSKRVREYQHRDRAAAASPAGCCGQTAIPLLRRWRYAILDTLAIPRVSNSGIVK